MPSVTYTPVDNPPGDLVQCVELPIIHETFCSYDLRCDNANVSSTCSLDENTGRWSCSCYNSTEGISRDFWLTGSEASSACVDASSLCVPSAQPDLVRECVDTYSNTNAYGCTTRQECTHTAALESGALVELPEYRDAYCNDQGGNVLSCGCSGTFGPSNAALLLSGIGTDDACYAAGELCGVKPSGDFTCQAPSINVYGDSCTETQVCGQEMQLPELGVTATLIDSALTSSCSSDEDDNWNCYCYGSAYGQLSQFPTPATAEAACGGALVLCSDATTFEPVGVPSCSSDSISSAGGQCSASATCTQDGSIDGTSLNVAGLISNTCTRSEDGTWLCSCVSLDYSEPFSVEGNEDAPWEACEAAIATCGDIARYSQVLDGRTYFSFELPSQDADAGAPTP